ncbi:MAG TPA: cation:proton antiporter [Gemmatimonadaceae bacterium]|nr:cation:proton antiporter [Gemmatimonadaceae bacterium]
MRRVLTLVLLYAAMQLVIPLDTTHGPGSTTLLMFGFLVLAAYTSGELSTLIRLPKITGYLIAGLLFGPAVMGIVSSASVVELEPVSRLAVAIIAFMAGAELRWSELKERGKTIFAMLTAELVLSFVAIMMGLWLLRAYVPFLNDVTSSQALILCALFASVTVVNSPAVTMALLAETRARGPVARTTLGIVLVADVVVVLIFSGVLSLARSVVPAQGGEGAALSAGMVAWEMLGALLVGALIGAGVALYMRFVKRELMLFAIVVAFLGAEIARMVHVETLLTLLTAGFLVENTTKTEGRELLHAMERSSVPIFVVFFALAGASINMRELAQLWPLAVAVVVVRAAAIFAGSHIGARIVRAPDVVRQNVWLGLVAQVGVAIGLASILANAYPSRGREMQTLILSVIAINQIAGQILFAIALRRSGELEEGVGAPGEEAVGEKSPAPAGS